MPQQRAIVVATIGTRDLIFKTSSGLWYNVGDDRMQDGDIIGEQAEVISDLGLGTASYRHLTQYLLDKVEIYRERIRPVIFGKLLQEKAAEIDRVYLVATNQKQETDSNKFDHTKRDTIYSSLLIQDWLAQNHPNITAETIELGSDGTNPADFEQMFRWWRQTWSTKIQVNLKQPLWVCLKGGVGQASEACRISGLSLYGDRIQFFEFQQNNAENKAGIPSNYTGPFLGTNYLWDRTRQQALQLLERYDYAGVFSLELLQTYFQQDSRTFDSIANLVKAGLSWNQGNFDDFYTYAKPLLTLQQKQQIDKFWWQAYEEAYLSLIRLKQNNTTEAMFHSFRAVEGILSEWAIATFSEVSSQPNRFPILNSSIVHKYPRLKHLFESKDQLSTGVPLELWRMQCLLEAYISDTRTNQNIKSFFKNAREQRNNLFHRISGMTPINVFQAWGHDINDENKWEKRVLNCLNLVTGERFHSLSQASIFASTHQRVKQVISSYYPEVK